MQQSTVQYLSVVRSSHFSLFLNSPFTCMCSFFVNQLGWIRMGEVRHMIFPKKTGKNMSNPSGTALMVISNPSIFCFLVCVEPIPLFSFCLSKREDQVNGSQWWGQAWPRDRTRRKCGSERPGTSETRWRYFEQNRMTESFAAAKLSGLVGKGVVMWDD